jgi:hypothetical protein
MRTWHVVTAALGVLALVECASVDRNHETGQIGTVRGVCVRVDGDAMPVNPSLTYTPVQVDLLLYRAGTGDRLTTVTTHSDGTFLFDWDPGDYYLQGTLYGHTKQSPRFRIKSGEITELRVEFPGQIVY